ncbi:hypothetical protein GCM10022409_37550 [Hymenobacter glaciei]|uniref:DinB-like domain-containing protein n=1 Tax=Hymenobacter glaciei TaxID=877209 RepID=A0ABP7UML7_9BACT
MLADHIPSTAQPVGTRLCREVLPSVSLGREVELSILLPPGPVGSGPLPVLYLNDGQDLERLHLQATLDMLYASGALQPFVVVAPHANEQRVQEYGTAGHPDFNGRGSLADAYTEFVISELLPFAQARYHASADPALAVMAGFSLGGLSAVDMVWHYPEVFARAGAFSGSFWWRQRAVEAGYTPADRIMHGLVRARRVHASHRFWLQSGTLDERSDRNENGVIDSIEDCLDLIEELIRSGLDPQRALRYVQVEGGHHHPDTWGRVMPDFLCWAFGKEGGAGRQLAPLPVVRLQLDPHLAPEILLPTASAPARVVPLVLPPNENYVPQVAAATAFSPTSFRQPMTLTRPAEGDYLPYALGYINQIPANQDPREALRSQPQEIHAVFASLNEEQTEKPYADGKWSLKEMLLHQIDSERIFAYRALRFARGDSQDLHGFEQDDYVAHSNANARSVANLLAEYDAVRAATLALFDSFTEEQLGRRGTANGGPATVRALLYIIPGHERHHLNIIRERYLPIL